MLNPPELRCDERLLPEEDDDLNLDGTRAARDEHLVRDERVLNNVLLATRDYQKVDYFKTVQSEIKPHMRKIVSDWMLEVCEEQGCHAEVFFLSMQYLDRVLSRVSMRKSQLQLLACVCIFIASKFKETAHITAEKLAVHADFSVTVEEITTWEILVLEVLTWDLSIATPYSILEQLLRRIDPAPELRFDLRAIREAAETLLAVVTTEFRLTTAMHDDVIAVACLMAAFNGIKGSKTEQQAVFLQDLGQTLCQIGRIAEGELHRSQLEIVAYVQASMAGHANINNNNHNNNNNSKGGGSSSNASNGGGSDAKYAKTSSSSAADRMDISVC